MSKPARLLAWSLLAALALVTVCPIEYRPDPESVPAWLQRTGAFALLGFLFAAGYPRHRWQVLAFTVTAAGALEASQMLDTSRHGCIADFAVKAGGGVVGVIGAFASSRLSRLSAWIRA